MPLPTRLLAALCLLLCQACSTMERYADRSAVSLHAYRFDDGGSAHYYVIDKRQPADASLPPATLLFVVPGSDCVSLGGVLPHYFDGLEGRTGPTRIFILHKRFIPAGRGTNCGKDFIKADHPSRWIADQEAFIRSELAAASANGQTPRRVVIAGLSEGAEIVPVLARRIPPITHVVLISNGGMDPFDAYRLQMQRHGLEQALTDIERLCATPADNILAAERSCRYWRELQAIRHTENLLALDIPVLLAMGEADTLVPVESAWHIHDRFAAHGKDNLHLLLLPDAGHDLHASGKSLLPYLWDTLESWLQK